MDFNNLIIQYFYGSSNVEISIPIAYTTHYVVVASPGVKLGGGDMGFGYQAIKHVTLTGFTINHVNHYPNQHCITIGY